MRHGGNEAERYQRALPDLAETVLHVPETRRRKECACARRSERAAAPSPWGGFSMSSFRLWGTLAQFVKPGRCLSSSACRRAQCIYTPSASFGNPAWAVLVIGKQILATDSEQWKSGLSMGWEMGCRKVFFWQDKKSTVNIYQEQKTKGALVSQGK